MKSVVCRPNHFMEALDETPRIRSASSGQPTPGLHNPPSTGIDFPMVRLLRDVVFFSQPVAPICVSLLARNNVQDYIQVCRSLSKVGCCCRFQAVHPPQCLPFASSRAFF